MCEASCCTHSSCSSPSSDRFFSSPVCLYYSGRFFFFLLLSDRCDYPVHHLAIMPAVYWTTFLLSSAWSHSGRSKRKLSVVTTHFIWRTECTSRTPRTGQLITPCLYCHLWKFTSCRGKIQLCLALFSCLRSWGSWLIKSRYECMLGKICAAALIRSINQGLHWDLGDCGTVDSCAIIRTFHHWISCNCN